MIVNGVSGGVGAFCRPEKARAVVGNGDVVEVGIDVAERLLVLRPKAQDFVLALRLFAFVIERRICQRRVLRVKSGDLIGIVGRAFFQRV